MAREREQPMEEEEEDASSSQKFELSCLCEKNSGTLTKSLRTFIEYRNTVKDKRVLQVGNHGPLADDFTPWWEQFSAVQRRSTATACSKKDPDMYESWFSKTSSDGDNWLCGPQREARSAPVKDHKSQVEDIPVPSIYENKLTSKSRRALKRERKAEKEKTLGKKWFDMRAPDKDDPARVDMELIRMRGSLDPKRFYKHQDRKAAPKYFQIGTVVDEGTEFYGSRLTKKQRKHTLVEELMADANIRQYNKKKYAELQQKMKGKKKMKGKRG